MSIKDRARTGIKLTLLASLLATSPLGFRAASGDGPLFQVAKAFAKDGDRDRSDDRDDGRGDDSGGRSGSGGRGSDDGRGDDSGGRSGSGGRGSDDERDDDSGGRSGSGGRGSDDGRDDDSGGRSGSGGRGSDDDRDDDSGGRSGSGGRGSDDDRDDRDDDDRDDDDRRGRSGDDRRSGGGSVAAGQGGSDGSGLRVVKIERSSSGLEVSYSNGVREEIANGRYEMKNAAGRTVLERRATQADVNRMQSNAGQSGVTVSTASRSAGSSGSAAPARLPAGSRPSRIEIAGRSTVEVSYASGWREEVEAGRYELKDPANRTVVERPATGADLERLMGLAGR